MNDVKLVKHTTEPYVWGLLKISGVRCQWRITSITHWGMSDGARYMVVGYVPEDTWCYTLRGELRIRIADSEVKISDDGQVMEIRANNQIYTFYTPAHSVDNLEFQLMLITPSGISDN